MQFHTDMDHLTQQLLTLYRRHVDHHNTRCVTCRPCEERQGSATMPVLVAVIFQGGGAVTALRQPEDARAVGRDSRPSLAARVGYSFGISSP